MKTFSVVGRAIAALLASLGNAVAASVVRHPSVRVPQGQLGAVTLPEAAKINSGDVVRAGVIEMFAQESDLLMVLPFENIPGNALKYNREGALPGIAFRGVNEAFPESSGVLNPQTEGLVIAGGDLDVDRFLIQTMGQQVRSTHERMKVKALAAGWTSKFIKGDSSSNPREFDGLQKRLINRQVISAGSTAGGAALSLGKIDEAIDAVTRPTHLLMNKPQRRRFTAAARDTAVGGFITYTPDAFGRRVTNYNEIPMLLAYDEDDGDEVLPFTEAATGGGAATATSIYILSLGTASLYGIQNGTMDVRDLGELQAAPVFRTRVEWYTGIVIEKGRAAARLRDIGDLALVK